MTILLPDIESSIVTKHHGESDQNPPLWILWINTNDGEGWSIRCICNSEYYIRYSIDCYGGDQRTMIIERVPTNHIFVSSIEEELRNANLRIVRKSYSSIHGYRRNGD